MAKWNGEVYTEIPWLYWDQVFFMAQWNGEVYTVGEQGKTYIINTKPIEYLI